ncbi:hypothetical protein [Desulfovibrio litoralis]|uniref:Uncharacterized protein n=1 Tax=Desulfovibrio litoralis DSM 11393 TaxID=1121455 RepID=A0A1M7T2J3_9BACT|nr:hypothetical protein [Desulfovibrio litoralis]SHN64882.1 hypothetical protein SAMN02745728_01469 [Desulfovibrio litoralis DSM 11393]
MSSTAKYLFTILLVFSGLVCLYYINQNRLHPNETTEELKLVNNFLGSSVKSFVPEAKNKTWRKILSKHSFSKDQRIGFRAVNNTNEDFLSKELVLLIEIDPKDSAYSKVLADNNMQIDSLTIGLYFLIPKDSKTQNYQLKKTTLWDMTKKNQPFMVILQDVDSSQLVAELVNNKPLSLPTEILSLLLSNYK